MPAAGQLGGLELLARAGRVAAEARLASAGRRRVAQVVHRDPSSAGSRPGGEPPLDRWLALIAAS